jgi:hypothetical protein
MIAAPMGKDPKIKSILIVKCADYSKTFHMAFLIFLRLIVNIESLLHKTFSILIILPS